MAVTDTKRAKKLVAFREVERDRASMALSHAKAKRVSAEAAVSHQVARLEEERARASLKDDASFQPETMQLILACIEATRDDLTSKEAALRAAEAEVDANAAHLMKTHRQMRQTEMLLERAGEIASKRARDREQRDTDDLAISRGKREP
jgi:flagellar export protein FliJ